jgi:hypothetical protein
VDIVLLTGEQKSDVEGQPARVEVEVRGGAGRLAFAQLASGNPRVTLAACLVDGAPRLLTAHGSERGALLVGAAADPIPALAGPPALDEAGLERARPVLALLEDGLYTLSIQPLCTSDPRAGFVPGGAQVALFGAQPLGMPVAMVVEHSALVLGGARAAEQGAPGLVITADVIVDAPGFIAHQHDRGAREAFSRAPRHVLADVALRDTVARHAERYPTANLGPLSPATLEPAGSVARALVLDLGLEDVVEATSEIVRVPGPRTELVARVRARTILFEIAFITSDGRRVDEVLVRANGRLRASGVRPAARAIARVLRQLADEGA